MLPLAAAAMDRRPLGPLRPGAEVRAGGLASRIRRLENLNGLGKHVLFLTSGDAGSYAFARQSPRDKVHVLIDPANGHDFEADSAAIAAEPETQRWWAECIPCLELLPDRNPGDVWSLMEEVFHLD